MRWLQTLQSYLDFNDEFLERFFSILSTFSKVFKQPLKFYGILKDERKATSKLQSLTDCIAGSFGTSRENIKDDRNQLVLCEIMMQYADKIEWQ